MTINEFLKKYGKHSTTNFQLIKYAKELKIPNFHVCMKDELNFETKFPVNLIVNIQSSEYKGIHWGCLYIHHIDDKLNAFFFDSYGLPPQNEVIQFLKQNNINPKNTIRNTTTIQKLGETYCGQLCLYVLKELNKGKDFKLVVEELETYF